MVCERLSRRRRFNPTPVVSLTFIAPIADALQYVMLSTGSTLNFVSSPCSACSPAASSRAFDRALSSRELPVAAPHAALAGGAALMAPARDGVWLLDRAGADGLSTLALASFVAVAGIMLGTAAGLRGALRVQPLATA